MIKQLISKLALFSVTLCVLSSGSVRAEIYELLALVNDSMWLGHFGIWESEGLPMFRHALPLRGAPFLAPEQVEDLLDVTISECERFYPAFQFLVWGGKNPSDALDAAIIETVGEA